MIKNNFYRDFWGFFYYYSLELYLLPKVLHHIFEKLQYCFSPRIIDIFAFSSWTASENLLLLVASQNQIIADNVTSQVHNVYALIADGSHIVAVDFDSTSGRVFWSDGTQGKIWSAFQNGTDRKVVSTFLRSFGLTTSSALGLLAVTPQ